MGGVVSSLGYQTNAAAEQTAPGTASKVHFAGVCWQQVEEP
jgi:hypothetical protein